MTQILSIKVKCSVCGEISEHDELISTNTSGYPDLDTRPPEMQRSTMDTWLQECPNCGYVSANIENKLKIPEKYLESDEYKTCTNITFKNDLSKEFYRNYLINLKSNDIISAFYSILQCAWICDDSQDRKNAVTSRKIAIELADKLVKLDIENKEDIYVIKADLKRRIGEFNELINEYQNINFDKSVLNDIIEFQIKKANEHDDKCYTLEAIV